MYELTKQQNLIIDTLKTTDGEIVLVDAKAGTGKTSTSQAVVEALHPKKGLYTAFNKAIVMEGKEKFTENIDCRTLHSLALSFVRPKLNIEDFPTFGLPTIQTDGIFLCSLIDLFCSDT